MVKAVKQKGLGERLKPTGLNHIFYFDQLGDGRYREVAVVRAVKDRDGSVQSIYFIEVNLLDKVDQGRLKSIITNQHADKYELWDLLSQNTLSNGKNALDYFHQLTRVEHGPGAVTTGFTSGFATVQAQGSNVVGSEFTDPASASLETQSV